MSHLRTVLLALLAAVPASSDGDPVPSRARATRLLQRGQAAQAQRVLAAVVARDEDDGAAWLQLGSAALALGRTDEARAAFGRAAELSGTSGLAGPALYNLACLEAKAGEREAALATLARAVEAGFARPALLRRDPDLTAVRDDPRFAELVAGLAPPPAPDPGAPTAFVEDDARVLWEARADSGLDAFGWQSEAAGDVNGDGVSEVLVGAPRSGEGAEDGGKVWVLDGKTGAVVRTHVGRTPGGRLGYRVKPAGDLDGDDVADYLATAPGGNSLDGSVPPDDAGLEVDGELFLWSGATGEVLRRVAGRGGERLGFDAAVVGDLDGDGAPELLVGAPRAALGDGRAAAGRAYVLSGASGAVLRVHEGARELDRLGSAVGAPGDLDGDGVADYVLGAPGSGPSAGGTALVFSGADGELRLELDPERDGFRPVEFGRFFASSAGDATGDGVADLYLADVFDQGAGLPSGRVYVYDGRSGALALSVAGTASGDWYGIGRGLCEDVDGDGVPDLLLAALAASDGAPSAGRIDVRSGRDGRVLLTRTCATPYLSLGYDVHPVGDADGDGIGDWFVTGSWALRDARFPGRGVLLAGSRPGRADDDGEG